MQWPQNNSPKNWEGGKHRQNQAYHSAGYEPAENHNSENNYKFPLNRAAKKEGFGRNNRPAYDNPSSGRDRGGYQGARTGQRGLGLPANEKVRPLTDRSPTSYQHYQNVQKAGGGGGGGHNHHSRGGRPGRDQGFDGGHLGPDPGFDHRIRNNNSFRGADDMEEFGENNQGYGMNRLKGRNQQDKLSRYGLPPSGHRKHRPRAYDSRPKIPDMGGSEGMRGTFYNNNNNGGHHQYHSHHRNNSGRGGAGGGVHNDNKRPNQDTGGTGALKEYWNSLKKNIWGGGGDNQSKGRHHSGSGGAMSPRGPTPLGLPGDQGPNPVFTKNKNASNKMRKTMDLGLMNFDNKNRMGKGLGRREMERREKMNRVLSSKNMRRGSHHEPIDHYRNNQSEYDTPTHLNPHKTGEFDIRKSKSTKHIKNMPPSAIPGMGRSRSRKNNRRIGDLGMPNPPPMTNRRHDDGKPMTQSQFFNQNDAQDMTKRFSLEPNAMAAMYKQRQQQNQLRNDLMRPDMEFEEDITSRRGKSARRDPSMGRRRISQYRRFDTPGAKHRGSFHDAQTEGSHDFHTEGRVSKRPTMNMDRQKWLEEEQRALKKKLEMQKLQKMALQESLGLGSGGDRRATHGGLDPNILKRGMKIFTPTRSEDAEFKKGNLIGPGPGAGHKGRRGYTDPAGGPFNRRYDDINNNNNPGIIPNEGDGIHPFNPNNNFRLKPNHRDQHQRTPSMQKKNNPLKNYAMFGNSPTQPTQRQRKQAEYNSPQPKLTNKLDGFGGNTNRRRKTSGPGEMRMYRDQNAAQLGGGRGQLHQDEVIPGAPIMGQGRKMSGGDRGRNGMFQSMYEFDKPANQVESRRETLDPNTFFNDHKTGLDPINTLRGDIRELNQPQNLNNSNFTIDSGTNNPSPYTLNNNKTIEYETNFSPSSPTTAAMSPVTSQGTTNKKSYIPSPTLPPQPATSPTTQYRSVQATNSSGTIQPPRRIEAAPQPASVPNNLPVEYELKQTFVNQNMRPTHTATSRQLVSTSSTTPNQSINNSLTATIVGTNGTNFRATIIGQPTEADTLMPQNPAQPQFIVQPQQPQPQSQPQQPYMIDPLLLQRNKDYSYDGKRLSFMERILNQQYTEPSPGFLDYMLDVGHQVTCARTLKGLMPGGIVRPPVEVNLPYLSPNKKKLLLLDLDETLIHSVQLVPGAPITQTFSYVLNIPLEDGTGNFESFGIHVRPYCHEFMRRMSQIFDLAIFTASTKPYCDPIVNGLDKDNLIKHRLYRIHCTQITDKLVKDLSTIKNRSIKDMMIIDNLVYSYAINLENGIPIKPYIKGQEDCELEYLANVLEEVNQNTDIPTFLQEKFKFNVFYARY